MHSVKSSMKRWKITGTRLFSVLMVIVVQALGLGTVGSQELLNRASMRKSPTGTNLPEAGRGCSQRLHHQSWAFGLRGALPPGSAMLSAGWEARTDGWISARAPRRPYWTLRARG